MSKYIIVTDTHCGHPKNKGNLLRLFTNIYEYAEALNIPYLIHLGDYWHNRKSIDIHSLLVGLGVADNINAVFSHSYIIIGNHDTIYKDSISSSLLSLFDNHKNITVINEPKQFGNILLLPWLYDMNMFGDILNETDADVLMGHFDINGCRMNASGTVEQTGRYSQGDFKNFKLVLSGHYHTPGVYGNIQYLGSPYHMSFNDIGSDRGFYVFDDSTCELEFIQNTSFPRYVRIKDTEPIENIEELVKGNIVEFIFTKDHGIEDNTKLVEAINSWNPHTLIPKYVNIEESMTQEDMANEDIEIKDHLGILKEYYEYSGQPEHIDIKMLMKMAEKIYEETING